MNAFSISREEVLTIFVDPREEFATMEKENLIYPSLLCEDRWPLWRYVKHHGRPSGTSGNASWTCSFCDRKFKGSYSRVRAHLLKDTRKGIAICPSVCHQKIAEMLLLEEEASNRRGNHVNFVHIESSNCSTSTSAETLKSSHVECDTAQGGKKKSRVQQTVDEMLKAKRIKELDNEIAEMFYSAGLPSNLAQNPHFVKAFSLAASLGISGYKPPSYDSLKAKLLEKEESNRYTTGDGTMGECLHKLSASPEEND